MGHVLCLTFLAKVGYIFFETTQVQTIGLGGGLRASSHGAQQSKKRIVSPPKITSREAHKIFTKIRWSLSKP
jgi:hypothetical protein